MNLGFRERGERGRLRLTGRDRQTFLQGMVTNDVAALTPGTGCYAFQLDPTGHVLADLRILCAGDALWLDVEPGMAAEIAERLDGYLIMERCRIEDVSQSTTQFLVAGSAAAGFVQSLGGTVGSEGREGDNQTIVWDGSNLIVARSHEVATDSFEIYLPRDAAVAMTEALVQSGAETLSEATVERLRVEAGVPRFGVDIDPKVLAPETGQGARAIHYRKGCYIGQEIVARIDARGHTNRAWTGFRLAQPVAPGSVVAVDGKPVGRITSCVDSPACGPIALGYLRNEHRDPGTAVECDGVGGAVAELPFSGRPT